MDPAKSKRQAQAAATQDLLLRAASGVFAARGYQGTTVGAITQAANTAHGTFYLYFRNKEDVFAKVVEGVVLEVYDRAWAEPKTGSPRDELRESVRSFLDVFVRHGGIFRCLLEGALTTPAIETIWRDLRAGFVRRAARELQDLRAAGEIRDVDPDLAANALAGMVEWTATTQFLLRASPADDATLDATASTLADLWYHALFVGVTADSDT